MSFHSVPLLVVVPSQLPSLEGVDLIFMLCLKRRTEHVPEILEVYSGLFDPQNEVFLSYIISACLAAAIILGLMWEYSSREVRIRKVEQSGEFLRSAKVLLTSGLHLSRVILLCS